jgi:hypothetical protein
MPTPSANREPLSSRLVVCEKTGRWASQLRRLLLAEGRWLAETRSVEQWLAALAEHPASLSLVEVSPANFDQVHAALACLSQQFPIARVTIASDTLPDDAVWQLREAGAIHAVDALRRLDSIVGLWRRHAEQYPPLAATELDRVLAALPWSE